MRTNTFDQIAGWSAILSAFLYLISILGLLRYISADLTDMDAFAGNMMNERLWMLLYGWPGIIATLLIFPVVIALRGHQERHGLTSQTITLISFIGLTFVLIGYLFHLAFTYFHMPMYLSLDPLIKEGFAAVIRATIGIQDMFWLGGDLFAFGGIATLLLLGISRNTFPRWSLFFGIVAGVMASLGSFSFLPAFKTNVILGFLFISGFICFAIWEVTIGIVFLLPRLVSRNRGGAFI